MSVRLMGKVFELDVPAMKKLVLLAMADHARDDGTGCYPAIGTLAAKTSLSVRGVQKTINDLEAAGYLRVAGKMDVKRGVRVDKYRHGVTTEYTLTLDGADRLLFGRRASNPARRAPLTPHAAAANPAPHDTLTPHTDANQPRTACRGTKDLSGDSESKKAEAAAVILGSLKIHRAAPAEATANPRTAAAASKPTRRRKANRSTPADPLFEKLYEITADCEMGPRYEIDKKQSELITALFLHRNDSLPVKFKACIEAALVPLRWGSSRKAEITRRALQSLKKFEGGKDSLYKLRNENNRYHRVIEVVVEAIIDADAELQKSPWSGPPRPGYAPASSGSAWTAA